MSEYEFWDELGNIFNAIVAYQHKTIEFNKRYVNPWLRLGTVFDQNDHNADALLAHKKAIEIDQENGSNWLSLGDVYFKMGSFDDAIGAYSKAIELNPRLGWAYANLAFAYTSRQRYSEAVNCYVKSLELIEDEKDRAMIWNRLGNVYRKVNDYDNAFIAFQMADECDGQNTGFDDQLDEVTVEQRVMPIVAEVYVNDNFRTAEAAPVVTDEAPVVEPPVSEEPAVATVAEVAEAEAVAVETPVADLPVVEEPAIAEAAVVAELEAAAVEASLVESPLTEDSVIVELAEVAKPEMVVEQVVEPDASVVDASAPQTVISESVESVLLTDEFAMKQQPEVPTPVEVADTVETQSDIAEVEELVYEDINTEIPSLEMAEEPVVTEPVAEDSVGELVIEEVQIVAEIVVDESIVEEVQPEAIAEVAAEKTQEEIAAESATSETANEQVEAVADVSAEVSAEKAAQVSDETSTVEFVNDSSADTTVAFVMSEAVETFADPSALNSPVILVIENLAELIKQPVPGDEAVAEKVAVEVVNQLEVQAEAPDEAEEPVAEAVSQTANETLSDEVAEIVAEIVALAGSRDEEETVVDEIQQKVLAVAEEVTASIAEMESVPSGEAEDDAVPVMSEEPAYDEFLKDAVELVAASAEETNAVESQVALKSEIKVEPDTKNAHVWNELGNVYFNTGAFEEAIVAYSKAIELDDWFAWPYSNLALVYVQKEKYAEAILLYQRSIELFASDKEKAITWNRLGNVYRRLNDYDNAISCYQRADELDPNNATRSLRSRFSLLGSLNVEQSSTLAV